MVTVVPAAEDRVADNAYEVVFQVFPVSQNPGMGGNFLPVLQGTIRPVPRAHEEFFSNFSRWCYPHHIPIAEFRLKD